MGLPRLITETLPLYFNKGFNPVRQHDFAFEIQYIFACQKWMNMETVIIMKDVITVKG